MGRVVTGHAARGPAHYLYPAPKPGAFLQPLPPPTFHPLRDGTPSSSTSSCIDLSPTVLTLPRVLSSALPLTPTPLSLQGLNPYYIYVFFNKFQRQGWEMLGGVMLSVSGTETMFAAMGHFSQPAVAVSVI